MAGDPGQLGGLAGGEVFGVLPQRVATVLQLLGVAGHVHPAQQVPHPPADHVEGLGCPPADVERIQTERRVLAGGQGRVADPFRCVGADQADTTGPFRAEESEEL